MDFRGCSCIIDYSQEPDASYGNQGSKLIGRVRFCRQLSTKKGISNCNETLWNANRNVWPYEQHKLYSRKDEYVKFCRDTNRLFWDRDVYPNMD